MREGDTVSLGVKGGAIVLQSVAAKPTLAQLVNAITPENRHGETDWGALEGNETW
jgi:antitoxin MazE